MSNFSSMYPNIAEWTEPQSFIRVLDIGGMAWDGKSKYKSLDDALNDLEKALEKIIEEIG